MLVLSSINGYLMLLGPSTLSFYLEDNVVYWLLVETYKKPN